MLRLKILGACFICLTQFSAEVYPYPNGAHSGPSSDPPAKIFLDHADQCLDLILKEAKSLDIIGAAVIAFMPKDKPESWISQMKILDTLATDKANFVAVAYSKLGEMAVTLKDSGEEARKQILGEYGFIGGVFYEVPGGYLLGAFSGGPGEDDLKAARVGLTWLKEQF